MGMAVIPHARPHAHTARAHEVRGEWPVLAVASGAVRAIGVPGEFTGVDDRVVVTALRPENHCGAGEFATVGEDDVTDGTDSVVGGR